MKHLLITTALCLAATTAWAGGSGHAPAPTPSATTYNAAGAVAGAAAHSQASAGATAQGGRATARTGPITVNNSTGGGYGGGGYNGPRYTTPDAIAPSIVTANECALPRSFGISVILAGLGGGWANESENCKRQRMANYLDRAEDHATAREMRCLEDDMRRAAYSSGHPCAKDRLGWVK